jgi:hypothetical protein
MVTRILVTLLVLAGVAHAQPKQLTIGIFAPSVPFETAQQRLVYVQNLAKAIEQQTGVKTTAQPYANLAALKKANVDFAIVEGVCVATNSWKVLANANIGGSTSRSWALFASGAANMQQLKGKKLAYMQTGCADAGFIDNAMLDSEVDQRFWGARVGERDINAAVAAVSSYKTAQAVFAPITAVKGLTKLFDTGNVPNPAFVTINTSVGASIEAKVASAVQSYGAQGAISGWAAPNQGPYGALRGALQPVRKQGVFAPAESVRLDSKQILNDPSTLKDSDHVAVRRHFMRLTRMD